MLPFWKVMLISAFLDVIRAMYLGYGDYHIVKGDVMFAAYGSNLVPKCLPFSDFFTYDVLQRIDKSVMPFSYEVITPLNCHLWFLVAMFSGCALFFTYMEKFRRRKAYDIPVILLMLFIASLESPGTIQFPFSFGRGCLACACMIAAVNAKEWRLISTERMSRVRVRRKGPLRVHRKGPQTRPPKGPIQNLSMNLYTEPDQWLRERTWNEKRQLRYWSK